MKNEPAMDREVIFQRVCKILSELLLGKLKKTSSERIELEMNTDVFDDLGMDSLESLDFLTALEEEFRVNPDQQEALTKRKISEIVDYLIRLLGDQQKKRAT